MQTLLCTIVFVNTTNAHSKTRIYPEQIKQVKFCHIEVRYAIFNGEIGT
ncbi:hypothetical protein [uncultured Gammaproteobacteria bacterium]|nr:hypothetical protein [uncultured Gammaproteobacteria bacterium]